LGFWDDQHHQAILLRYVASHQSKFGNVAWRDWPEYAEAEGIHPTTAPAARNAYKRLRRKLFGQIGEETPEEVIVRWSDAQGSGEIDADEVVPAETTPSEARSPGESVASGLNRQEGDDLDRGQLSRGISDAAVRRMLKDIVAEQMGRGPQGQLPTKLVDDDSVERTLIFSDLHAPYEDKEAWEVFLRFTEWFQPHRLIANGDIIDMYNVSRFSRNPMRKENLQDEVDYTKKKLGEITEAAKGADRYFVMGNHEDRLRRYLWKNPELSSLDALALPRILNLDALGFDFYDLTDELWLPPGDILVTHGTLVRKGAGNSARFEMEKHGCHGVTGHCHRLAQYYKAIHGKPKIWCEGGHLSDVGQVDYISHPDWTSGFTVIYHLEDSFIMQVVPILKIDGGKRIAFEGRLWS